MKRFSRSLALGTIRDLSGQIRKGMIAHFSYPTHAMCFRLFVYSLFE